jgi:predicted AAA+ superfamily ATPase
LENKVEPENIWYFSFDENKYSMKRLYLTSPSLCTAVNPDLFPKPGLLTENALLSLKSYRFFWRDPYNHEVDFIDVYDKKVIPTEVKYKAKIRDNDFNNLFLFCRKFNLTKAVMLTNMTGNKKTEYKGLTIEMKSIIEMMTNS